MATPANPKATHYELQLQSALCRGAWAESQPAKGLNNYPITWEELLRKYRKHCKAEEVAAAALQTQTLSLLLLTTSDGERTSPLTPVALDGDFESSNNLLKLGDECLLQRERREEATLGLQALRAIEKDDVGIQLAQAYYAYSLGEPRECISIMTSTDVDSFPRLRTFSTFSTTPSITASSIGGSMGSASGAMTLESALSRSGTIASSIGSSTGTGKRLEGEMGQGKVWVVIERLRGRCLQGMSHERLQDYPSALAAYDAGLPLLDSLALTKVIPPGKSKTEAFNKFRELWRWSERLLRRAAIVSASIRPLPETLRYLRVYQFYSQHWLSTFRSSHRAVIAALHLRALCLYPPSSSNNAMTPESWREETRRVATDLKWVLDVATVFPRAGEVNHKVNDFVDLCVAVWEKGGATEEEAGWVIDTLWWATRLTFHSHRIMRHLSRLLVAQQKITEAKRTFKLYVEVVSKARQTSAGEVSLQLKRRPANAPAAHPEEIAEADNSTHSLNAGEDADDDRTFAETLTWGTAILSKASIHFADAKEVAEVAKLARDVVESSPLRDDNILMAKVMRALGIASSVLAFREPDANLRPTHQASALEYFAASAQLNPSSASTFYHLSFIQAETREIDAAVESARQSVEKDPGEIRAWHMLGLLLTAQGDTGGAKAVLDLALESAEEADAESDHDSQTIEPTIRIPSEGVSARDYAAGRTAPPVRDAASSKSASTEQLPGGGEEPDRNTTPTADASLPTTPRAESLSAAATPTPAGHLTEPLLPTTSVLPPSSTLHLPIPDVSPMSKSEQFEAALQVRISQLALAEQVDGAETANLKWPELFTFFSEHCPSGSLHGGSAHSSVPTDQPSSTHLSEDLATASDAGTLDGTGPNVPRLGHLIPPNSTNGAEGRSVDLNEKHFKGAPQRLLHKGHRHMHSLSKKIIRNGDSNGIHRTTSAPDFHAVLATKTYQASSIHSRTRFTATVRSYFPGSTNGDDRLPRAFSPPPPPTQPAAPMSKRPRIETRLLSDLWVTSAATFRRMGKLEQALAAIQEAEVLDEENPNVWVQLGLYHAAQQNITLAKESLHKALVIEQDHIGALVHLAQQYLTPVPASAPARASETTPVSRPSAGAVDLAAGLLNGLTQGQGWDVPEAWYFLAKACKLQGRKERERECLIYALKLQETRCIRALGAAVPRCL